MCKFVRLLVPWDSVTHDLMPVVGPHDDKLAKVLQMGAESTFNDCIEVRAYLTNTLALYKMMQNESEPRCVGFAIRHNSVESDL